MDQGSGVGSGVVRSPMTFSGFVRFSIFSLLIYGIIFTLQLLLNLSSTLAILAFTINWLVGAVSVYFFTERVFDFTGAVTYVCVILASLLSSPSLSSLSSQSLSLSLSLSSPSSPLLRPIFVSIASLIWSVRLGLFLITRIMHDGKDKRFDDIKPNTLRFFNVWQVQAVWVYLTSLSVFTINNLSQIDGPAINSLDFVGALLWVVGFLIEVISDAQKRAHRHANPGKFITTGLWAYSRHPNYVGEITLWIGIFVIGISVFLVSSLWCWLCVLSPIFVIILLTRVSGIPMLETHADEKWGNDPEYVKYKNNTPVLLPFLPVSVPSSQGKKKR